MTPAEYASFLAFYKSIPTTEILEVEDEISKLSPFYKPGESSAEQHATIYYLWDKYVKGK
jgi:hypothetical protein